MTAAAQQPIRVTQHVEKKMRVRVNSHRRGAKDTFLYPCVPFCMAKRGTKRVLEYARLAMGFANGRASRYGIR